MHFDAATQVVKLHPTMCVNWSVLQSSGHGFGNLLQFLVAVAALSFFFVPRAFRTLRSWLMLDDASWLRRDCRKCVARRQYDAWLMEAMLWYMAISRIQPTWYVIVIQMVA